MLTNTYLPLVGGVSLSVKAFSDAYRRKGHRVMVICPEFEGAEPEEDVVRIPALQRFNGSDFAIRLPIPGYLSQTLNEFDPEIVHSHHPFLLGDTAQRVAAKYDVPLVFTHHTMYERYTHYVPGDSPAMKRFVIELATGYANLCDRVIAPSESVAEVLERRGVRTPIRAIPTGVDLERFREGDGPAVRRELGIPDDAFVVGHAGRLAPEKNLAFLARAVTDFLRRNDRARFLVAGAGPSEEDVRGICRREGVEDRLHLAGKRTGQDLVDAYHAMDVFAFASRTETQGMVLTEAMACGLPVVAVDAPGAREVVRDGENGRLLEAPRREPFREALAWVAGQPEEARRSLRQAALETAERFSMPVCAEKALALYGELVGGRRQPADPGADVWERALRLVETEWELWASRTRAAGEALERPGFSGLPVIGAILRRWPWRRRPSRTSGGRPGRSRRSPPPHET